MQISKPIIYGTIATWLGRRSDEKKTHSWICYVRGAQNEDLSYFIEKVIFVLHSSFDNTNRGKIYNINFSCFSTSICDCRNRLGLI